MEPAARRRRGAARALGLLLASALGLACASEDGTRDRPDVVLIVIDTIRTSRLGLYGNERPTSQALDALAEVSSVYTRAYSQAPWTTPSIGSLLTSQYPSRLGIRHLRSTLPDDLVLLSEALQGAGWKTGGVVSHDFCGADWGFDQGFDFFDDSNALGHDAVTSPAVTDLALGFLDAHPNDPVFLFVHYFDPHFAYIEHDDFSFPDPPPGYQGPVRSGMTFQKLRRMEPLLNARDVAEIERIYDSEVAFTDFAIGRLLERLRSDGRFDDAIIVVTGDHGEEFLDHGGLGHTRTLYEELIRVPLLIKYPGGARSRIDEPVALIDLYPTLLDALGLDPDASLRGRSLLEGASGEGVRPLFAETSREADLRAVVRGDEKLILDLEHETAALYELSTDPNELRDLAPSRPEQVKELRLLIEAWMAQNPPLDSPRERQLSEEELEKLRALGYR